LFFCIFGGVGAGLLYPFGIRPILKTIKAQSWPEVPCRIISAQVKSHSDSDGTTYSVDIRYEYEFNERKYSSSKYSFVGGSSSGYKRKAKIVNYYKSAAQPVCFVNPDKPSEAVLKRGWHLGLLFSLFPLPFLAVGVGGVVWTIKNRGKHKLKSTTEQWLPEQEPSLGVLGVSDMGTGALVLKPKSSAWGKFAGSIVIAAFWNGIVSVFVVGVVRDWSTTSWFMTLFMIPFVLIGLGLIGAVFYCLLALFNPRVTLTLNSGLIPLGGLGQLSWQFSGVTNRIRKLKILLRGREEARYQRGTKTYTDKSTFFQMELCSSEDRFEIPQGEAGFAIPSASMHSFEARNNKLIWEIAVHGDIKSWPDVREEFKITVTPAASEQK
jgi:hypothetical protein